MLVWLATMTGARRGELLALRRTDVHWAPRIAEIRRSFTLRAGQAIEKDTQTHQLRRVALDETTFALLAEPLQRAQDTVALVNVQLPDDAFVFSYEPDNSRPCNPDPVGHRNVKMYAGHRPAAAARR